MTSNPYAAPGSDLTGSAASREGHYTQTMVQHLRETKPWVRFFAVLGFIGIGFMVLGGLAMVGIALVGADTELGPLGPFGLALFYMVAAGLYLLPTLQLNGFASACERVVSGGGTAAIEDALNRQRSFWRILGIMAVVGIVLWVLMVIGMMVAAVVGASMIK